MSQTPAQAFSVEATAKFDAHRFSQRAVPLMDSSGSVEYRQSAEVCNNLLDHSAHGHKFADELSNIAELEEYIAEANYYINTLYTYRSFSKPLPMIPAELEDLQKKQLYKQVFDILTPQINKIKGLMEFHDRMVKIFTKNLRLLVYPFEKKEPMWRDHIRYLNKMVDKFAVLDALKDMKGQMRNDFARYKRAFAFTRAVLTNSGELMAEITAIYNFLNDPQHPYHVILFHLKEDVKQVPHREELMGVLISQALADINDHIFVTANDKHRLYRSILASMYIVDEGDINCFKSKHIPVKEVRALMKVLPLIPIFMDMSTTVALQLALCEHWTPSMESDWMSKKHISRYNLVNWRTHIQEQYIRYTAEFVALLHEMRALKKDEAVPYELQKQAFHTIREGLKLMGDWSARIREQVVFKSANPIDDSTYVTLGGKGGQSQVYEQITRFNYDNDLKYAMVEIIGLIKGLANLLLENEARIRAYLAGFVHHALQEFTHQVLLMPLFRSYRKKKGDLTDTLFTMRLVASDSYDINKIRQDYQQAKEKQVKKLPPHKWPRRNVFPSRTQVLLLRRLMFHVFSDESPGMKGGLFSDRDLKKNEVETFSTLHNLLHFVPYVANFATSVKECSDLSDIWFREFYLNMTGCIQFPIAMSMPWMLTDYAMNTPSLAPNVFFPLSIYNDCGEKALTFFHQQHLFDEIEAEVNLVFDQLIFSLYRKIFDYYKNKAASILMDKPFQRRMETVRAQLRQQMLLNYARYSCVFQQKSVQILGRTIDIQSLLTEQMNSYVRENVDGIIARYEQSPITAVCEIDHLLRTLRLTVDMLREELPGLDAFDDILIEVNEDATLGSFRGRLFLATYNQLFSKLLRNFQYNQLTQRFVSLDPPKGTRRVEAAFLWGTRFTQVYHQIFKVTKGFFGIEHLRAVVRLMGVESMPLLVDELVKTVAHIIIRDISPYVTEILNALDPMKQQPAHYGVLGVYGYYDLVLQFIKSYPALREGVFTLLREAGNALCLVQMLDTVLTHESYYDHQIQSFYMGVEPAAKPDEEKSSADDTVLSDGAAVSSRPSESPFVTIVRETLNALRKDQRGASLNKEQKLFESCIQLQTYREKFLRESSGGWLFSATLDYLYKTLEETGLLQEWKGPPPKNGILEHENPKDFARFWSVATWIFLCPDFSPEEEAQRREEGYVSDRAYFGDGWLWAGCTILYLTGLRHRYRLLDPTIYIDKLQRLYPTDLTVPKKKKRRKKDEQVDKTEMYKPFVRGLLLGWKEMEKNADLINSILSAHYEPLAEPIDKFTPVFAD